MAPAQITADSRYVIVMTQPPQAEVERAGRGRGTGGAAANRQTLAIVSLADGKVTSIPGVRSFRLPRENGTWIAYVPEPDSGAAPAGECRDRGRGGRGGRGGAGGRPRWSSLVRLAARAAQPRDGRRRASRRRPRLRVRRQRESARVHGRIARFHEGRRVRRNLRPAQTTTLLSGRGDYNQIAFDRAARRSFPLQPR